MQLTSLRRTSSIALRALTAVLIACASLTLTTAEEHQRASATGSLDAQLFGTGAPLNLNQPIVGMAAVPNGTGYWLVAADGGIFGFGGAPFLGSTGATALNEPIVGMAATPSANGYWLVANDGGIFAFGDASFFGSTGAIALNKPIEGMAATPSGNGYWLVANDGGIFAFGDATFFGSTGAVTLAKPIVGMASTPSGNGYWLVASDGGIFAFGDATFFGSTGALHLTQPIVDMASSATGHGYWLVAADGGIFAFGDATFYGAGPGCFAGPVVSIASSSQVRGYWQAASNGQVNAFSTASSQCTATAPSASGGSATAGPSSRESDIARDMFTRLNDERAARGLPRLDWDDELATHARSWSTDMATNKSFRHSDLNPLLGRFTVAAENIAYGRGAGITSGAIHRAWMTSEGHRVNMAARNLDVVGIGVACAPDGTLWATQQYGRFPGSSKPSGFGPTPSQNPIVRSDAGTLGC